MTEAERIRGIALGARRVLMDFHEDRIDAGGNAGGCQRLDVLRQAGGHAVARARQLQAVRHVEDDRVAQLAQHRERPHVNDQVVVAEADAALRHEHALVAGRRDLGDGMAHVVRRQKLSLLDIDDGPRARGGNEEIRLTRQKRRDLNDVRHRGCCRRLSGLVDVREDRQSCSRLDVGKRAKSRVEPRASKR